MNFELGQILGGIIVTLYILAALNYVIKLINRKYISKLKKNEKNEKFLQIFQKTMRFLVRNHKLFGGLTIIALLLHFPVQFYLYGLSITGAIAGSMMVLQASLGFYGSRKKTGGRTWLLFHRSIAALLLVAIGTHIL